MIAIGAVAEQHLAGLGIARERVHAWLGRECKCSRKQFRRVYFLKWLTRVQASTPERLPVHRLHLERLLAADEKRAAAQADKQQLTN